MDKVESVIGKRKFVFLNRFYVDETEVPQTHKIAAKMSCKVDGDL